MDPFSLSFRSTYKSILDHGGFFIEMAILIIAFKSGATFFCTMGIIIRFITAFISGIILLIFIFGTDYEYNIWNEYLGILLGLILICLQIGYIFFINFFNMIMGNLVEEQRAHRIENNLIKLSSMTSMYWAIHAMFAKPFNGVGTIIGTWILERSGYTDNDDGFNFDDLDDDTKINVQWGLFHLITWFMLISAFIQYIFFRKYDLKGNKLKNVQNILKNDNTNYQYAT